VITGVAGLAFLISVVIGRPLLLSLSRAFMAKNPELASTFNGTSGDPARRRGMTIMTTVVGFTLLADGVAHIIMALTLPTVTFLVMSRVVTVAEIAVFLGARRIVQPLRQRADERGKLK